MSPMLEIEGEGGFQRFEVFQEESPEISREELGEELKVALEVAGDGSLQDVGGFAKRCWLNSREREMMSE